MKNILQRDKQKRDKKIQHKHTALSNRTVKKESGGGGCQRGKNEYIYIYIYIYIFKAKEREQYQNNGTEDLFIVIMYLIEAFKIRLLLIAGSFESRKRSNSTFK